MSTDGERLDRVQLLRERAAARHAHRRDGVRQAREQDQPLRNERHDGGDRRRHRVVQRGVAPVQRPAERDAERDEHRDEDEQEPVDRPLERRARMPELARLARRPARRSSPSPTAVTTYAPAAFDRERARAHLLAGAARTGSASPVRIDSSSASPSLRRSVPSATTWSPASSSDDVAFDDLVDRDSPRRAVSDDGRGRRDERGEPVERPLRAHLLRDPDARVRDEDRRGRARPATRRTRASATPATSRIRLKIVKTFATTMLLYERLDVGSARRAATRACARPPAWSVRRPRRSSPRLKCSSGLRRAKPAARRRSASRTSRRASRCGRGCRCAARG